MVIWTTENNQDGSVTVTGYKGGASVLNIPETIDGKTVTAIGRSAFENNKSLRVVNIPDTVINIDMWAFNRCINLKMVGFGERLTDIGWGAFDNCTSLTEAILPESLTTFSSFGGFVNCTSLERVYVPSNLIDVYSLSSGVFAKCDKLNNVTFGERITAIPENLFRDCTGLTHIEIPSTVTSVGRNSFNDCANLRTVTFSKNMTEIGSYAFNSCPALSDVYYGGTADQWKNISIDNYNDPLKNAKIHYNSATDGNLHGKVSVSGIYNFEGEQITLTMTPDPGYKTGSVSVVGDSNGQNVPVSGSGDTRTFLMPAFDVTIHVEFIEI